MNMQMNFFVLFHFYNPLVGLLSDKCGNTMYCFMKIKIEQNKMQNGKWGYAPHLRLARAFQESKNGIGTRNWLSCVETKKEEMIVIKIELIDPRAKILLEDLAKLNLIKIQEVETSKQRFSALLSRLRSKEDEAPSLEEITKEVESVRVERKDSNG